MSQRRTQDLGRGEGGGGGHACGRDPKHSQLGGMGERCKLPHRGLGKSPRSQRFLRFKTFQNYVKIIIFKTHAIINFNSHRCTRYTIILLFISSISGFILQDEGKLHSPWLFACISINCFLHRNADTAMYSHSRANPFILFPVIVDLRYVYSLLSPLMERSASQLVRGQTVIIGNCCFL